MIIFDPKTVRRNRSRALQKAKTQDKPPFFLMDWAVDTLCERLNVVKRDFDNGLVFGLRQSPDKLEKLRTAGPVKNLIQADSVVQQQAPHRTGIFAAEADMLPLGANSMDALFHIMTLHTINDLPGALIQVNRVLKPDGLFMGCLFGGETLFQLRESFMHVESAVKGGVSPRIFPFADKQQMGALMQRAGFALPVIDSEIITVTYENSFALMQDLRAMGENNAIQARSKTNPGQSFFMDVARHYQQNYSDNDGRIEASFEIIFLLGWSPHHSQQQPSQRGSATISLADALNTEEIGTGAIPPKE